MLSSSKTQNSLFLALLFVIIAAPQTFGVVNQTIGRPILRTKLIENGVPTRAGLLVHAAVFFLITYLFLS